MNQNREFFVSRAHKERGQILPLVALSMAAILGMAALVFDVGVINYSYAELQASTQAATFAGAYAMALPNATAATTTAAVTTYSGLSGNKNARANLPGVAFVTGYPKLNCFSTLKTVFGIECIGAGSGNGLVVEQTVKIPLVFANLFGTSSLTLTSTATASMRGVTSPYNVVIVMDTTQSMNNNQNYADCMTSALTCALQGVQVLLQDLSPCPSTATTCGAATFGNPPEVANSVDRVSLLAFPAVATPYSCGGTVTTEPYWATTAAPYPAQPPTALAASTYQIVNFVSDYRTSDQTTTLNTASALVKAVGHTTTAGCLTAPGGQGTYYAQVIAAAQAYLVAEQSQFPNSQNVMILLSDGDANATCNVSSKGVCTSGPMAGASTTAKTGVFPPESTLQECHQAIAAAQAAWAAGTTIYAVNFGAEASGCSTDTSPTISPCQTMLGIATNGYPTNTATTTYFSDDPSGGSSACAAYARPTTSLNQIFAAIAGDLTVAKLIPNGTT